MKIKKRIKQNITSILIFMSGLTAGVGISNNEQINEIINQLLINYTESDPTLHAFPIDSNYVELCFTPATLCGPAIVRVINEAKESIFVQAYGISSPIIVDALINAHKRGVIVRMLLDRSNLKQSYSKMSELKEAGIEVNIDKVPGIAHNKVMVIDRQKVITGSFNFTRAADNKNAENVIIIKDYKIAQRYLQNWYERKHKNE